VQPIPLFLEPGEVTVTGDGGTDVGGFAVNVNAAGPVMWTNRDQIDVIDRSEALRLTWTGNQGGQALIIGINVDYPTNSSGVFACLPSPAANSFDVPAYILSNISPSRILRTRSAGFLILALLPAGQPVNFDAAGIDFGQALSLSTLAKAVIFR
jgi:hypothetical protein